MTRVLVCPERLTDVGQRLISEGEYLVGMGQWLSGAVSRLDWESRVRIGMEDDFAVARGRAESLGRRLIAHGRRLIEVGERFERADSESANGVTIIPWRWLEGTEGVAGGTDSGGQAGGDGSAEVKAFLGTSISYDLGDERWESEREVRIGVEGALHDAEDSVGDVVVGGHDVGGYRVDARVGTYEYGAKIGRGDDGYTVGLYAEAGAGELTAEGVLGDSALGLTGAVGVAGPAVGAFAGLKDGQLGVSIGGSVASAEAELGLNLAGVNVGLHGELSAGFELGFRIGRKRTEVALGPFRVGLSFGRARGE